MDMNSIVQHGFIFALFLSTSVEAFETMVTNHSFATADVVVKHLNLDLKVDFDAKVISGRASLQIQNRAKSLNLVLDTRDLIIKSVTLGPKGEATKFSLGAPVEYLGQALIIDIRPTTKVVNIDYETSPEAAALQWLAPSQTADKKLPFLFTQSQAILARTWIPCQDTPSVRVTYDAKITVPKGMMALMSAQNRKTKSTSGVYRFQMRQPIPSYLFALAVGDIAFKPIDSRTGVYAEPSVVAKAAWEFADLGKMLSAAEALYGPYQWGRYDVIVLPPSFPFGGMENPRITFLSSTVLAGDRSLVSLLAHELAHSWSGNLVTNATWEDFWLNEGFTNYFERRIIEALYGAQSADMKAMLGLQALQQTIADTTIPSNDKHLHPNMKDRNPDDSVSDIAYEKGSLFLKTIESVVGREKWDAFLKTHFKKHEFHSVTTEQFLADLDESLLSKSSGLKDKLQIAAWVDGPTIPSNAPKLQSKGFADVDLELQRWLNGTQPAALNTHDWVTDQWIRFLTLLPKTISKDKMRELDESFKFTSSGNAEILTPWLEHAIRNKYEVAYSKLKAFLTSVGRRKFLKPLYLEMAKTKEGTKMAHEIYAIARPGYHSVAIGTIDAILKWKAQ